MTDWTPAMRRLWLALGKPHYPVLGLFDDCLACLLDGWAQRGLLAARQGMRHHAGRTTWRHREVAVLNRERSAA